MACSSTSNGNWIHSERPNRLLKPIKIGGLHMDFIDLEKKITQSGGELIELMAAFRQLQARVDRHSLVIQALKEMLLSHGVFSEDELLERLEKVALQKADDKNCRKCGKAMSAKHKRCMYCGAERP